MRQKEKFLEQGMGVLCGHVRAMSLALVKLVGEE